MITPGRNGQLVAQRDAQVWADAVDEIVTDNANSAMSNAAVLLAQGYTWRCAAQALEGLVARLLEASLVRC